MNESVPLIREGVPETRICEMVFPELANHYGTLFGGNGLSLMGKAAFIAATRYARAAIVMKSAEKIEFCRPVKVGELVELYAYVIREGRTSLTVDVEMIAEGLISGERALALKARFEMVSVDETGKPRPIRHAETIATS